MCTGIFILTSCMIWAFTFVCTMQWPLQLCDVQCKYMLNNDIGNLSVFVNYTAFKLLFLGGFGCWFDLLLQRVCWCDVTHACNTAGASQLQWKCWHDKHITKESVQSTVSAVWYPFTNMKVHYIYIYSTFSLKVILVIINQRSVVADDYYVSSLAVLPNYVHSCMAQNPSL